MGLFRDNGDSQSDHACPIRSLSEDGVESYIGGMTFYQFNMILAGACTAFACLIMFILMFKHSIHLSKPNEQIKILKICLFVPFYSILSFLSICFPAAEVYIRPWFELVQAVSLASFFLLMCEYISPSPQQRDVFFAAFEVPTKLAGRNKGADGPIDGLTWYRKRWIATFQYPIVALLVAVVTDITQAAGIYCEYTSKPYFARLWLKIIVNVSLVIALTCIFSFYMGLRTHLANHKPLHKLLALKLVVFTTFVQSILFWILNDTQILHPTQHMTWADLNIGIPNLISCIEMVPFSLFFYYAYSDRPYIISSQSPSGVEAYTGDPASFQHYQGGFLGVRAWTELLNPSEFLNAILFAFKMAKGPRQEGQKSLDLEYDTAYEPLEYRSNAGRL